MSTCWNDIYKSVQKPVDIRFHAWVSVVYDGICERVAFLVIDMIVSEHKIETIVLELNESTSHFIHGSFVWDMFGKEYL